MTTQHFVDKTLEERADEREAAARNRTMTKVAGALVNLGLAVSALLTIAYLTLLTQEAAGLLDPWGYVLGGLVGVVAIIPAELGLIIWRERLAGERQITSFQRGTAVVAMLLAGVFSALTTSSFFSYTLPQLFPPSYLAIAPTLNVGAIVGAWIVFILAVVFYAVSSRETQQNLASAAAFQSMFDARVAVLRSSAEAVRTGAQNTVVAMEQMGVFERDARRLIVGSLGYDADALATLPHLAKTIIDQPPDDGSATDGPATDGATQSATGGQRGYFDAYQYALAEFTAGRGGKMDRQWLADEFNLTPQQVTGAINDAYREHQAHKQRPQPATPAPIDQPFGLPAINLVDLGYNSPANGSPTTATDLGQQEADGERMAFYPVSEAPAGSPQSLTFGGDEWKMMWIGSDGYPYSRSARMPADTQTAWDAFSEMLPPGMTFDRFVELHEQHNRYQQEKLAGNFTNGRSNGRQGA